MKKVLLTLLLVVGGFQTPTAQDIPKARALAAQLVAALAAPLVISTPAELNAQLAAATPGATLTLASSLVYLDPLTLTQAVTLRGETTTLGRVTLDEPLPSFRAGLTITGSNVTLVGVEVRQPSPLTTIVVMAGESTRLERVRILGDSVNGAKRGVAYTGSNGIIVDSYIAEIFQPAQDTQAVYSDNMGPGTFTMSNSYFAAAGEVVMFGGGDAPAGRDPHDVSLVNCVLDKKAEWATTKQTKCSLELKNIKGFTSTGCVFIRGGGISQGQGGYAFDLTPRNQSGGNPTASVQNVLIEDFLVINPGSGIATMTGSDNNFPSGPLKNVVLRRGTVTGVDHNALSATHTTGRLFTFDRAPQQITIADILVKGLNIKSICYFSGLQPPTGLNLGVITVDNGGVAIPYSYKLDGSTHAVGASWPTALRAALLAYMPDAVLDPAIK